jgi:hypothetical protein
MRMPDPHDERTYETRDLWLAAALIASGRRLSGLAWREGRAFFVFSDAAACAQAAEGYWSGELRVSAKAFADGLRDLKNRLHDGGSPARRPGR